VILVDGNILIYARIASIPQHQRAQIWLNYRLNGSAPVGLPWSSLLTYLRVTTNRRIFERPMTIEAAWSQVREWLSCRPVWIPEPGDKHADILGELLLRAQAGANLVPDAHLAALAIEHGLKLCSADGDFARFAGLTWENPIVQSTTA